MGQITSKKEAEDPVVTGSLPSTPILMPRHNKVTLDDIVDPRSPSQNITRTPIQATSLPDSLEHDSFNINSPVLPSIKALVDPRSPTTAFDRTPIVIRDEDLLRSIHKKKIEGARKILSDLPSTQPPELSNDKRNSLIGVLETNIDFVETDLDDVMQKNTAAASLALLQHKVALEALNVSQLKIEDVSDDQETAKDDEKDVAEELEPKLSGLIYTDEENQTPPKSIACSETKKGCRAPLGVRNDIETKKTLPKLKVSDKPRRSQFAVSKIPRFRHPTAAQCENTPPHMKTTAKNKTTRRSQWDTEHTLII